MGRTKAHPCRILHAMGASVGAMCCRYRFLLGIAYIGWLSAGPTLCRARVFLLLFIFFPGYPLFAAWFFYGVFVFLFLFFGFLCSFFRFPFFQHRYNIFIHNVYFLHPSGTFFIHVIILKNMINDFCKYMFWCQPFPIDILHFSYTSQTFSCIFFKNLNPWINFFQYFFLMHVETFFVWYDTLILTMWTVLNIG